MHKMLLLAEPVVMLVPAYSAVCWRVKARWKLQPEMIPVAAHPRRRPSEQLLRNTHRGERTLFIFRVPDM
jgi:hypothetical protein